MARSEEVVGSDNREAHRVLIAVPDALRSVGSTGRTEEARVRGDEECPVLRVHSEPVDVNRARVLDDRCALPVISRGVGSSLPVAAG